MAMADQQRNHDDVHNMIRDVDEVCREAERVRAQVEKSMNRQAFWPDRRKQPRFPDTPRPDRDRQSR